MEIAGASASAETSTSGAKVDTSGEDVQNQSDNPENEPEKSTTQRGAPRESREDSNNMRTAEMVNSSIVALNERGGSSIQAIKKYMAEKYNVDTKKKALFIKKYLISAVNAGVLHRTRGSGAAGSFQVRKGWKADPAKPQGNATTQQVIPKNVAVEKPATSKKRAATAKRSAAVATESTDLAKKIAEADKRKVAAEKQKITAARKQAAADKKLREAMKKLAAVNKREAAKKASGLVNKKKKANEKLPDKPSKSETPKLKSAVVGESDNPENSVALDEVSSTAAAKSEMKMK